MIPGKDQLQKILEWSWDTNSWFLSLSALEQSWLKDSQWCVASQICSCARENITPLKAIPFREHSHRGATGKHTYIHTWSYDGDRIKKKNAFLRSFFFSTVRFVNDPSFFFFSFPISFLSFSLSNFSAFSSSSSFSALYTTGRITHWITTKVRAKKVEKSTTRRKQEKKERLNLGGFFSLHTSWQQLAE